MAAAKPRTGGINWADADEDDDELKDNAFTTGPDENGIITNIEYIERDGKTYKVIKKVKQTIVKTWTNEQIQNRKSMEKFGKPLQNDPAVEKKLVVKTEDDVPIELSRRLAVQVSTKDEAEDKFYEESLTIADTLNNQKKAWTEANKVKQEARDDAGDAKADDKPTFSGTAAADPSKPTSGYVPPALRNKGDGPAGKGKNWSHDPQQEASLRVTNLSEDVRQGDLEDLFSQVGRLSRVYLAKDPTTGNSRGFAFVTYYSREDAQRAIAKLNGHGYDNLILQVQFAKPRA